MNIKRIILSCVIAMVSLCIMAQGTTNNIDTQYDNAQALYDNGDFEKCEAEALEFVSSKKGMIRTSTYKLLALCRLAEGDVDGAKSYVGKLLKYDPYFTPSLGDPQRFIDIINENKNQEAGITTASRQAESLDEAPVPVTLITDEMIRHSGCTTLQELLCLYVPGMTLAEGAESNIAMHGIYSLMQDKILIMLDGHRLNSSSTNAEAPDYRTSLDKVQQIEVLRGPASSLYGNVALTAVVNIITRKGAAMNGGRISGMGGTQHTTSGSIVVGGGNNVVDLMGWGYVFASRGFTSKVPNGDGGYNTLYAHGYNDRPSYDIGVKGRWKDFTMSVTMQRSKQIPYCNVLQLSSNEKCPDISKIVANPSFEDLMQYVTELMQYPACFDSYTNYNYDRYESINGNKPGVTRTCTRINLDYSHSFDKFDIQASGYINFESTSIYNVLGDSVDREVARTMLFDLCYSSLTDDPASERFVKIVNNMYKNNQLFTKGVFQTLDWSGVTYGLQAQALTNYNFWGKGSLVFGSQFEIFSLSNSNFILGGNYTGSGAMSYNAIFHEGTEHCISGYLQLKHFFTPKLIFNAGLRYDRKTRFDRSVLDRVSPRFAIIYKLPGNFSLRGNYNYSFVDAPYIYRACVVGLFSGGIGMKPETMHGFNVGMMYSKKHFTAEIGPFYNILNDLTVLNPDLGSDELSTDMYIFANAGRVRTLGVDACMQYTLPRFFTNVNATWQRVMTSEDYIVYNSQTYSTPAFHANVTAACAPYKGRGTGIFTGGTLWLRGTVQFQTATDYKSMDLFGVMISKYDVVKMIHERPQCVVGLGATYEWKYIDLDISLKNMFNNQYKIGSMLSDGVPRTGRAFLVKGTFKF